MFDFRYHVVSLIAVFAALAVGILLGVTIADKVVSGAEQNLSESLRGDLKNARKEKSKAQRDARRNREFESLVYPAIVDGRLSGRDIGIIAVGGSGGVVKDVRKALEPSGARLVSISTVRLPPRLDRLSSDLEETRFADIDSENKLVGKFGEAIGRQLVEGGRLSNLVKRSLFSSHSGRLKPLDGVVFVRTKRDLKGEEKRTSDRFETSLIKGMQETDVPIVAVEKAGSDPSQIRYYRDHDLTSVDDIDRTPGKVAMVLALKGAKGHYGIGPSATQLLPQTLLVESDRD